MDQPVTALTYVRPNLRLYLANRSWALYTPIYILIGMTILSVLVGALIGIVTGFPLPEGDTVAMRYNAGAVYSIPGFLFSVGVLAMNRNFSMALAFGSTRRNFWFGSALGFVLTSLLVGLGSLIFLGLEFATDHWFINARAFDVDALGNGDPWLTFASMFVLSLVSLFAGAFFGTIFRAFGTVWTVVAAIVISVLTIALVAVLVWQWDAISDRLVGLGDWLSIIITLVLAILAAAGSYGVNRLATV